MSFDRALFESTKRKNAQAQAENKRLKRLALDFIVESDRHSYAYQWTWLGLPIIQLPPDIIALQEVIWANKPDVIIETGIAWGGSTIFHASILELIGKGRLLAIDIVLPEKNLQEIMSYPFSKRIKLFQGSSIDPAVVAAVEAEIGPNDSVMVVLDSNHSHEHVLAELRGFGRLVTRGQFLVVGDTIIADLPEYPDRVRPWSATRNPKTALDAYLKETNRFAPDEYLNSKLLFTYFPNGYLRCIK